MAVGPDGTTTVVWSRSNGTNFIVQASTRPSGGTFASPVDLSATGGGATGPQVAVAPDGATTVVWYASFSAAAKAMQASTRPAGGTFGAPVDLSSGGQYSGFPELAVAADLTTIATWVRSNGTNTVVQASSRPSAGAFGAPVDLSAVGCSGNAQFVHLAARPGYVPLDGTATATVIWERSNGANSIVQAASANPPDTQVPSAPAGLTGTASRSPNQVVLNWTASADDVGVVGYRIYRRSGVASYADRRSDRHLIHRRWPRERQLLVQGRGRGCRR